MVDLYSFLYRHVLKRIDPERAHGMALRWMRSLQRMPGGLKLASRTAGTPDPRLATELLGLRFANPLGVAAGMDKDAQVFPALWAMGFGHVEVGTVTPRPQPGNPKPRVWRAVDQRALVNTMGFPSVGVDVVRLRLGRLREGAHTCGVLGVNLGKNRDTPLPNASEDYARVVEALFAQADYFTLNVSSPNTPQLRELQLGDSLRQLIGLARQSNTKAAAKYNTSPRPLLVKLSPDLEDDQVQTVAQEAVEAGADGLIATNTTVDHSALGSSETLPGGLSGAPLAERARRVIALIYQTVGKQVPIIGVGGVSTAEDVMGHMRAGASLVQLYTGFVYGGPSTAGRITMELSRIADREGWGSISEIVGTAAAASTRC